MASQASTKTPILYKFFQALKEDKMIWKDYYYKVYIILIPKSDLKQPQERQIVG